MKAPLAVVVLGDLPTGGNEEMLGAYRYMWEQKQTADSIHFPVYPGLGNHDTSKVAYYGGKFARTFSSTSAVRRSKTAK